MNIKLRILSILIGLTFLVQATEIEKLFQKSVQYGEWTDLVMHAIGERNHCDDLDEIKLVRYIKDEKIFKPIDYQLTSLYAQEINNFIENYKNIKKNSFNIFFDIFYFDIKENQIQEDIYKAFFLTLLHLTQNQKLHWKLSLIMYEYPHCKEQYELQHINKRIHKWVGNFCSKQPLYYSTGEYVKQEEKPEEKTLFVNIDVKNKQFSDAFTAIIENEAEFYKAYHQDYKVDSDTNFLKHEHALIDLFPPIELDQKSSDVIDLTLYPIDYARGWLYETMIPNNGYNNEPDDGTFISSSGALILKKYPISQRSQRKRFGHDIGSRQSVYNSIKKIKIDFSRLSHIRFKNLVELFPNIKEIELINDKKEVFLSANDAYFMLREMILRYPSLPMVMISGDNVQVSYQNIIISIIRHWCTPYYSMNQSPDSLFNFFFVLSFLSYALYACHNIPILIFQKKLILYAPFVIFMYPFLLSKEKCMQIIWGRDLTRYPGDQQDFNYYLWRHGCIAACSICWFLCKIHLFFLEHGNTKKIFTDGNFFLSLYVCIFLINVSMTIGGIAIVGRKLNRFTPYINEKSVPAI